MTDVSAEPSTAGDDRAVLNNRPDHRVYDNQNQRTVGARGPASVENHQFLETARTAHATSAARS